MIYCFNHSRMSIYHHAYGKNSAMVHPPQIRSSFAPGNGVHLWTSQDHGGNLVTKILNFVLYLSRDFSILAPVLKAIGDFTLSFSTV